MNSAEVPLTPITPRTITAETVLRKQLDAIRRGAVAEVIEEFTPGVAGMAVAIASRGGVALGAINLAIPAVRFFQRLQHPNTMFGMLRHPGRDGRP